MLHINSRYNPYSERICLTRYSERVSDLVSEEKDKDLTNFTVRNSWHLESSSSSQHPQHHHYTRAHNKKQEFDNHVFQNSFQSSKDVVVKLGVNEVVDNLGEFLRVVLGGQTLDLILSSRAVVQTGKPLCSWFPFAE
jgi:hypothetical protein